jgi:hypothetical protein
VQVSDQVPCGRSPRFCRRLSRHGGSGSGELRPLPAQTVTPACHERHAPRGRACRADVTSTAHPLRRRPAMRPPTRARRYRTVSPSDAQYARQKASICCATLPGACSSAPASANSGAKLATARSTAGYQRSTQPRMTSAFSGASSRHRRTRCPVHSRCQAQSWFSEATPGARRRRARRPRCPRRAESA